MKRFVRETAHLAFTLHIYFSMAGLVLVLLFAVTGLTLNHDDFGWSEPTTSTTMMTLPRSLLDRPSQDAIGQYLRGALSLQSPAMKYRADDDEIDVTFTAPGSRTQVMIHRADGVARVESESRGLFAKLDDLHKGLDSGNVWRGVIDITAVLLILSSITGILTLVSLPKRRVTGFLAGAVVGVVLAVVYWLAVPR
jgi:uncharacterized protein